jgi:glycosyltransferase involved in cell wall biosynthesis
MRILFLTNAPNKYRTEFFNQLGEKVDLTVVYERKSASNRDASWSNVDVVNFKTVFLKGFNTSEETSFSYEIIKYLKRNEFDHIIVGNPLTPTGIIAIAYLKHNQIKYYIESDGGFAKSGKGFKEKFKRHVLKSACGYFSTGAQNDKYFLMYGAKPEKIHRYHFSSIKENDITCRISTEKKEELKKELNLTENKIVLNVGSFIQRKGNDVLIKAMQYFPKETGVYIVGGLPTAEYIDLKQHLNLNNLHFIDFKNKSDLKKYYQCADVFCFPTREDIWGLVINEAMSNGLPIVTTDKCVSGLELIENKRNGFIVPADNINELADKTCEILTDEKMAKEMSNNNLNEIRNYTIESMVEDHMTVLNTNH